jgi:hypothetical protein
MAPWLTQIIVTAVTRKVRERLKEKAMNKFLKGVKWVSVIALAVGSVSQSLGLDLAPEQIDIIANAVSIVAYAVVKLVESRRAA